MMLRMNSTMLPTKLYQQMLLIRVVEDKLQALCNLGQAGDLHFGKGQEAVAVGVCSALRPTDLLLCHHRMIPWAISKGVPLEKLIAELLGKATGICGGLGGEMHMRALEYGLAHTFQLVGTVVPVAAGVAWALKNFKKNGDIAVAVFGDAATSNGQFHEGLNLAAVQKLPLLLVCENNFLAGNVRPEHYIPVKSISERAGAYGISARSVDGNDVEAVKDATMQAAAYVRQRSAPFLLVCDTARLGRHKQGQGDLRSPQEMAELTLRDPLKDVTDEDRRFMEAQIDEIVRRIEADPEPLFPKDATPVNLPDY